MSKKNSNQWVFSIISAVVAIIAIVIVYIAYLLLSPPEADNNDVILVQENNNGITVIEPARPMSDFTLTNQFDEAIQLSDLIGKPILLSFGFTHCPDVCPITLGEMRAIHEELGEQADNINFLFISVDGARDTPEVLAQYFETLRVDSFMIGMTGTEEDIRAASEAYAVYITINEPDENGFYLVDHTAGMYLLEADGNWIRRYTFGTESSIITEDVRRVLGS